ncbi:FprA family A-type flavoprotein [Microaceticoccus formicicus]|uniref:FprA family A-type flavoprotein n=1 Tax=Microaceticoccus formicicus TaxID=3118105 RepID=UPI003CCFFC1E|nr:FprA family A-type flavoprotein [Peptoniphilaceae bacterium AMB_02]
MELISVRINDFLHYVGVNDRDTHLFENLWPLENGVSYNSYLINAEKTALLDTVKITKVSDFTAKLRAALGDKNLDYLVIHHMEPDHSGAVSTIRELYPDVQIVGNKRTIQYLEEFYGITENILEVKDGETLDLGDRSLTFYTTPMVHWPESMVSYEPKSKILFSQDAFGGFGALDGTIFDDEINLDFYHSETRRYFSNIVGKFSKQVQSALKKLAGLEISMVCPVHGPIWRSHPEKIIELYDKWSRYEVEEGVIIVYGSMYGNTQRMAEVIARELAVQGISNIKVFDVSKTHESYILSEIWRYKGLILGSCTYNNYMFPLMTKLVNILDMNKIENHVLGVFGSYSWSGGAVKALKEFGEKGKYDMIPEVVEAKCAACDEDIIGLRNIARTMAHKLKEDRLTELTDLLDN